METVHYMSGPSHVTFRLHNNNTKYILETMELKGIAKTKRYAVESFLYSANFDRHAPNQDRFCHENSSANLRSLIKSCEFQIRVRNLNEEERKQLQSFKNQPGQLPFKMVYDKNLVKTQSIVNWFYLDNSLDQNNNRTIYLSGSDWKNVNGLMQLKGSLSDRSFVIEGQGKGSGVDCYEAVPDLKPVYCSGDVKVKPLANDNYRGL